MKRPMNRMTRALFLFLCIAGAGCSTIPMVDGRKANEVDPDALLARASELQRGESQEQQRECAEIAEWFIRNRFDDPRLHQMRWLAAESRYTLGDYEDALIHYRRLLTDDPFTTRAGTIARRLFAMGKQLIHEEGRWFGDLSSRHDVGIEAMTLFVTSFPRDPEADDGWKELAQSVAGDGQHQAAADIYERMIRDYPESEWSDLAHFQVAQEYRALTRGGAYDVDPLLRAYAAFDRYLQRWPEGNSVAEARSAQQQIAEEIGGRELQLAEYYRYRGSLDGQRVHLANAAYRFPETSHAATARKLLQERGWSDALAALELLKARTDRPRWAAALPPGEVDKDIGPGAADAEDAARR